MERMRTLVAYDSFDFQYELCNKLMDDKVVIQSLPIRNLVEISNCNFDVLLILSTSIKDVQNILQATNFHKESANRFVFTHNNSKENTIFFLGLGADAVFLYDREIIQAQFNVMKKRFKYYEAPIRVKGITLDTKLNKLSNGNDFSLLNGMETRLLKLLIKRQGEVVSFSEIGKVLLENETHNSNETAKVYIHRIRKELEHLGCEYIEIKSHYSIGYSLHLIA